MSTKIQWTASQNEAGKIIKGETWNPIAGCSKISDGCKNCYAIKDAVRLAGNPNPKIAEKYKGTAKTENGKMNWTGQINLASFDVLTQPLRWTQPRKIFVNSMSDLFHESVPFEWIDKIFAVMALCPQHIFQILTKRADRMRDYFSEIANRELKIRQILKEMGIVDDSEWSLKLPRHAKIETLPLPNVWLGVSVENQKAADERILHLLETPAAVRWLSCEPLLSRIDLSNYFSYCTRHKSLKNPMECFESGHDGTEWKNLNWAVVGGESGNNARQCNIDWIRSIVAQCKSADVPVFVKQLGANPYHWNGAHGDWVDWRLKDKKGGDISEFPIDLRVREFPK